MSAAALPVGDPVWERPEIKAALKRGAKDRVTAEAKGEGAEEKSAIETSKQTDEKQPPKKKKKKKRKKTKALGPMSAVSKEVSDPMEICVV
jgi:hypothetical protein